MSDSRRPARRAAATKKVIPDDSDEENALLDEDAFEEPEYTPQPKSTRRKTAGASPIRRTRASMAAATSIQTMDAPRQIRKSSPRKRKTLTDASLLENLDGTILSDGRPVDEASTLAPLSDPVKRESKTPVKIDAAVEGPNEMRTPEDDIATPKAKSQPEIIAPIKAFDTALEKPMDIVIRSRALPQPVETSQTPKARMVIHNLFLINFKSYAGRQEVGPFHASFSSVVGPNGSGKSNVIDSLLFVFGFRASKMRQGKISALIHNSAAHPNLDSCEVEVHFQEVIDGATSTSDIPNSLLTISRKAFKNNASKYYINQRESNFTDVTSLLRGKGIDLDHKRFLILQGEVESIAQMKPKAANEHDDGLLEYLEDIIGTSKYKQPIDDAATEIDTLNEVCLEKNARFQHVQKEKSGLEDKRIKALAYVRDENDVTLKQAALYQVYLAECDNNIKVSAEAIEQMQQNLNEKLNTHQGGESEIRALEKSYQQGTLELDQLQKVTQEVIKEMAKHDKERVKQDEKKKYLQTKRTKQEKTAQAARLATSEASNTIQKSSDDVRKNSEEIRVLEKSLEAENAVLDTIRHGLKGKTETFSTQITAKQKELEPWTERISQKTLAIKVAQSELELLTSKASAGDVAKDEVTAKMSKIREKIQEKGDHLRSLGVEHSAAEKQHSKLQAELGTLMAQEPKLRATLSNARQNADEARASLSSTQSQGNVLGGLMRLKESGRLDGFHGRLGNLGTIDQKYDVAISTACPSLDNLVVDNVEVGQQCIDYLRKNNLGRANIILLDRLSRRDLSEIQTPEQVPRLFDLVKAKKPEFRPAFFSVLQNTLVAKDLQQANRIAYGAKRWRVVTLDGQLIDVSGTMSGGGTRVARGGMSSKLVADVTKEQVIKLEADRDTWEHKAQQFGAQQRELEQAIQVESERRPALETQARKLQLEITSLKNDLGDAERRISEISKEQYQSDGDNVRMTELRQQIGTLEQAVVKLRDQSSSLEQQIKALQEKVMEIGGVKLRAQKAKVDGLREQIETLTQEITAKEMARSKGEKQKAKQEKAVIDAEKEISAATEELDSLQTMVEEQSRVLAKFKHRSEEAQEAHDTKAEQLARLKDDLTEKTDALNGIRAVELEMRNKLEESQKFCVENEKRLQYWTDKLKKLSLQQIEDQVEEIPCYTSDEVQDMDKEVLKGDIAILEERLQKNSVDLGVLVEYQKRAEEYEARAGDLQTAVSSRDEAKRRCDELRQLRLEGFMMGFSQISLRLKEMYQIITMGGNAELELVDSLDPFAEGILFSVMPPKKSWKNISNLSGGEKTLSSLALVFALHHYKPTPLYVMDEIDAALDFRNVSIVASYIKERTKNAQFIVISLRNNMFELAARLVGVYKVNHMTRSVTVENRDYMRETAADAAA